MILVHISVIMAVGKETIRRSDMLELRHLETLIAISLKSKMDGENYVRCSYLIVT